MYKVTEINKVKTYNLSAGKSFNEFVMQAKKTNKSLRYNDDFRRRIELIQDFSFEVATNQVEISPDQRYILAAGIYAPQIKVFDTTELSMKCLRGLDSEVIKFCLLSDDYSKVVMAQKDRTIEFHAQYGAHHKVRIPHYPRDLTFNPNNSNLCISASANQVYRMSLEEGKFLAPFSTLAPVNCLDVNSKLNVLNCGGDGIQVWDFRERTRVCQMKTKNEVTAVKSSPNGLLLGVGDGSELAIYDVRFDRKLMSIKASYNEPINCIEFLENNEKNILFSNRKQIKIVDGDGKFFTSIEPDHGVNMFRVVKDTGFILSALEDPKVGCYFIPEMGIAPKWVPYIENITEELEEDDKKFVYDEYKFVSKAEVAEIGCQNLINTKMLKEYMHGYLMHVKMYNKVVHQLDSANYLQKKAAHLQQKVQEDLPKRIEQVEKEVPSRFQSVMGEKAEFAVDKHSEEYMQRHPHLKKGLMKEKEEARQALQRSLRVGKKHKPVRKNR